MSYNIKILVIGSDSKTNRQILKALKLSPEWNQSSVDQLNSLHSAAQELLLMDYNVILADCEFLPTSPLETLIQLRSSNKKIPIILLNKPGMEKTAVSCLRNGADYYIIKDENWTDDLSPILETTYNTYLAREEMKKKLGELQDENEKLAQNNIWDETTMLYSKNYFRSILSRELKRASRYGHKLTCLVMDCKNGSEPAEGDYEKLGTILRSIVRSCDVWGRIDKNRFAALMPHTDIKRAKHAIKRIENEIEDNLEKYALPHMSVKWGMAPFEKSNIVEEDELIHQAEASIESEVKI